MGEIIRFPDEVSPRGGKYVGANTEPATVIILSGDSHRSRTGRIEWS